MSELFEYDPSLYEQVEEALDLAVSLSSSVRYYESPLVVEAPAVAMAIQPFLDSKVNLPVEVVELVKDLLERASSLPEVDPDRVKRAKELMESL